MATCPNKTLQSWKDLVNSKGEDMAYYLWDKYEGNIPESEYAKTAQVKPGVSELFESNPELANIGTPEQYSQYLDTIFPDSKEKDIFYHGLPFIENKDDFFRDSEDDGSVSRDNEVNIRLWNYFYKKRDRARDHGDQQYAVVLNFSADFDSKELAYKASPTFLTNDSAIVIAQGGDEYAVKSKKQIHILGSKQDIEGFKEFVKSPEGITTSPETDELSLYLSNKMNENFKISNPKLKGAPSIDDIVTRHVPTSQTDIDNKKEEC